MITDPEPITTQPPSQYQRWADFIEKTLQENPSIKAGLPALNQPPPFTDNPPSYNMVVFDDDEFHRSMTTALRSEKWENVIVNGYAIFSGLPLADKTLLWDSLKEPEVNFNPFLMDLTLKLAESELCSNVKEFNEFLKFVIAMLRQRVEPDLIPPPPILTSMDSRPVNQAEFAQNHPQVSRGDDGCVDICMWCCFWHSFHSNSAPVLADGGGEDCGNCCDCGSLDECGDCADCGDCF